MTKGKFILFLVLIFVIGFTIYWIRIESPEMVVSIFEKSKKEFPSNRAETFYISSGEDFPVFTKEAIVDPFKVREGEEQIFSVWAKDPTGIERVTIKISTDKGEELIELKLVEGTNQEGRWLGSWRTKDISTHSFYSAIFQAKNKEGKETKMNLSWQVEK